MKVRLVDREVRIRVTAVEVEDLLAGVGLSVSAGPVQVTVSVGTSEPSITFADGILSVCCSEGTLRRPDRTDPVVLHRELLNGTLLIELDLDTI